LKTKKTTANKKQRVVCENKRQHTTHMHNNESKVLHNWFEKYRPSIHNASKTELIKAYCFIAVQNVNKEREADSSGLILTENPKQVLVTKVYNRADLKLVATTNKIGFGPAEDAHVYKLVTVGPAFFPAELTFFCVRAAALPKEGDDSGYVFMFWHVLPTHYKKDSNVDMVWEERHNADMDLNITVPVFTNSKQLNIGDVLYSHDPGCNNKRPDTEKKPR